MKEHYASLPLPLVVTAFDAVQQSRDGAAPFLQEANFYWLTGIDEPGWRCIITSDKYYLVAPERDGIHRIFEGGLSPERALEKSGADVVISHEEAAVVLEALAQKESSVYTIGPDPHEEHYSFVSNPAPERLRDELRVIFGKVEDARSALGKVRAIKRPNEIEVMEHAVAITVDAFAKVKDAIQSGDATHERQLEAIFTYEMRSNGADGHAYEPIVAGGRNALTLHYATNNDTLPKNGLVLMDVGARLGGYSADITRTFAIGVPSEREREVHAVVEHAHHAIIALISPGASLRDYHDKVDGIMKEALVSLGLLNDVSDDDAYRRYFPHAISHGLGIDVHESLGGFDTFQPGMMLTVEPGIYIPEEGIGVRIEDDILVTPDGARNLSKSLPTGL